MSNETNSDEIPVNVISDEDSPIDDSDKKLNSSETSVQELEKLLDVERQKATEFEEKLNMCWLIFKI